MSTEASRAAPAPQDQALQANDAAWFRALVEYSPEAAYVVRDGIVLYANPAAVRLFGAPDAAALVGRDILERVHPDDHSLAVSRRRLVLELNVPAPLVEMRFLTLDGRIVPVEVQATAIQVGTERAIYAAARDISGRRELEEHLRQVQKLEAVGRLAGGVAHDFNNTLAVILGHTEFARDSLPAEHPLQDDLRAIQRAAQHSAALTRQLLTYARRQTITPRALDLNEAVSAALHMLRPLIGESIDLEWEPAAGVWPITLDPSQLDQILTNLFANARDAIDGVGTLRVAVANRSLDATARRAIPDAEGEEFVVLTVQDDGRGMTPEVLERAFEPFFTTKAVGAGTGLGLATVYGIMRQNHGALTAWSAPGSGTRFDLYFPRRRDAAAAPAPEPTPASPSGTETILVVEDEPEILRLAGRALEAKGYAVLAAAGPVDALRLAHAHPEPIDLLLTDVMMPVMTGPDLARAITEFRSETRVLFMSGFTADLIARRGRLNVDTEFIAKPFGLHELVSRVRSILDRPAASLAAT